MDWGRAVDPDSRKTESSSRRSSVTGTSGILARSNTLPKYVRRSQNDSDVALALFADLSYPYLTKLPCKVSQTESAIGPRTCLQVELSRSCQGVWLSCSPVLSFAGVRGEVRIGRYRSSRGPGGIATSDRGDPMSSGITSMYCRGELQHSHYWEAAMSLMGSFISLSLPTHLSDM